MAIPVNSAFSLGDVLGGIGAGFPVPSLVNIGTGILSGGLDYLGSQEQNASAKEIADRQMAFQERMSGSAHQREVADLKAAGLNPVLSANAGASTPAGASAPVVNELSGVADRVSKGMSTALDIMQMKKDFEQKDAQISLATANKIVADREAEATAQSARQKKLEADMTEQERDFMLDNPSYIKVKKFMDLIAPAVGTARDIAITGRAIRGFGQSKAEEFKQRYDESMRENKRTRGAVPPEWRIGR